MRTRFRSEVMSKDRKRDRNNCWPKRELDELEGFRYGNLLVTRGRVKGEAQEEWRMKIIWNAVRNTDLQKP